MFKIDCEGCEWDVLADIGDDMTKIEQLVVEFHVSKELGMDTELKVKKVIIIFLISFFSLFFFISLEIFQRRKKPTIIKFPPF